MTNRNSLLGRSRPTERLTKDEKAALDRATTAPRRPRQPRRPHHRRPHRRRLTRRRTRPSLNRQRSARTSSSFTGLSSAPNAGSRYRAAASPSRGSAWPGAAGAKSTSSWQRSNRQSRVPLLQTPPPRPPTPVPGSILRLLSLGQGHRQPVHGPHEFLHHGRRIAGRELIPIQGKGPPTDNCPLPGFGQQFL